jgi:D-alanyl-lipoteichoic acid acyltransferase DltB (MBOAT superfamily)
MLFNSYEFIFLFLPFALIGYNFLLSGKSSSRALIFLSICSLFFYGWWNPKYLLLILASITINYFFSLLISRWNTTKKTVLTAGIAFNLILLGYFKYADFFLSSISIVTNTEFGALGIILPLAISFFTFQQIAYLVDSYKGNCHDRKFSDYLLFVCFFPQLIAGPIVHHSELLPQLRIEHIKHQRALKLSKGLTLFAIGLAKKVLIADSLAPYATSAFNTPSELIDFSTAWTGTLAYTLQLYFDFSGYSDMAIGLGLMFGVYLPINFNSPYKAASIIDFWRRWHITLSTFLRDYLYIPLGGNQKGPLRRHTNLLITMLLGGLWHGASSTFVAWGGLHGILLITNHFWRHVTGFAAKGRFPDNLFTRFSFTALTFFCIANSWVLFRAESLEQAGIFYNAMYNLEDIAHQNWSNVIGTLALLSFSVLSLPNSQEIMNLTKTTPNRPRLISWKKNRAWGLLTGILLITSIMKLNTFSAFLYFQF